MKIELVVVNGDTEFGRELRQKQSAAVLNATRRFAEHQAPDAPAGTRVADNHGEAR